VTLSSLFNPVTPWTEVTTAAASFHSCAYRRSAQAHPAALRVDGKLKPRVAGSARRAALMLACRDRKVRVGPRRSR